MISIESQKENNDRKCSDDLLESVSAKMVIEKK